MSNEILWELKNYITAAQHSGKCQNEQTYINKHFTVLPEQLRGNGIP